MATAKRLIAPAFSNQLKLGTWADLGCGRGLFTTAMAQLLPAGSSVYAIDVDAAALSAVTVKEDIQLQKIRADFAHDSLPLPPLDGLLMANALHYVADQISFLIKGRQWLKKEGVLILIEYDTDVANPWVPYPLSFATATRLFTQAGFASVKKIGEQPSLYNRAGMYAAVMQY